MIHIAYDGSQNGDWIFRYALRFAHHSPLRTLVLFHVVDGSVAPERLEKKRNRLCEESKVRGVKLDWRNLTMRRTVFETLRTAVGDDNAFLVCGTRLHPRRRAYLSGTISEKLLDNPPCHTLAARVVQPGLLGHSHDVLIPLAGHPRGFSNAWPFFRLFLPEVRRVYLLRGMQVHFLYHPHISVKSIRSRRETGLEYLDKVRQEILEGSAEVDFFLDSRVVITTDWAREILIHASKLKAQIVLVGATERPSLLRMVRTGSLERVLRESPCDVAIYRRK